MTTGQSGLLFPSPAMLTLGNLFRKASNLLGLSSPEHRPPPLDGEIIYCKNNVCVHPPARLSQHGAHFPGYLNIRSQDDSVLGSTLILTWIPNSTLKRNPRSLENSPARGHPPRMSPRQEYAKSDYSSNSASPRSSQGSCEHSRRDSRGSLNSQDYANQVLCNNIRALDKQVVSGVGQHVNDIHGKTYNADRDQDDELPDSFSAPDTSPSSGSTSPTTERQLFQLLSKGRPIPPQVLERQRTGSSRSVTSIEMEGDSLVVVTEEAHDCAFGDSPSAELGQGELGPENALYAKNEYVSPIDSPPDKLASKSLDSDFYSLSNGEVHNPTLAVEASGGAHDLHVDSQISTESSSSTMAKHQCSNGYISNAANNNSGLPVLPNTGSDHQCSCPSGRCLSESEQADVVPDLSHRIRELQTGSGLECSTDTLTNSTDTLISSIHTPTSQELRLPDADRRASIEKLKESLDLNLQSAPMDTELFTPDISITGSPSGSSSTSGPDSRPPTPVTPPPFPLSPQRQLSSPLLSPTMNLQFPDNSVSYQPGTPTEVSQNKTATEQVCGVFSVDIGQMRSLRIFYSDDSCSSGQLVIASREGQYKILHFHHGGLDRLAEVFDDWKFLAQANEKKTEETVEQRSKHFSVIRPYLPNEQSHPEEGAFERVTQTTWKQHMNEAGLIEDNFHLRKVIFFAGLESSLRHELWPFLLHYYPYTSTHEEREALRNDKYIEYQNIRKARESLEGEEKDKFWRSIQCIVEKDVVRTDRSHPYFRGEDNPNIEILKYILLNYAIAHPHYGYTQGMSDLLAPVLAEVQHEADAYWCFVGLMQKTIFVSSPKDVDMDNQLMCLRELLRLMQPRFYKHLEGLVDGMELLFCHRWILLCFKREFPEADALRMWEACWARYQTDYFHLFLCVAIIAVYGEDVIEQELPADDMLLHFSSLSMHMSGDVILRKARALLHQFRNLAEIPCSLSTVCFLGTQGMWDSGHIPTVHCVENHPDNFQCPYAAKEGDA